MKIVIIGNSGSGKTWLAKRLSDIFAVPAVHLDDFFWEPGGFVNKRPREEVEFLIRQSREKTSWIAEGVFGELAEHYLDSADLLIWLDIEWPVCKKRLEERDAEYRRRRGGEPSPEGLAEFLTWAFNYYHRQDMRSYKGHKALFKAFSGENVHLRSEAAVNQFVAKAREGICNPQKEAFVMEALRIYQKPENGLLNIRLPRNLAESKELEIIILPVEQENQKDAKPFRPADYFGLWRDKNIDADKVCKEMRDEWERNF